MSGQAYLTTIEQQTGKTPRELIALANEAGLTSESKAGEIGSYFTSEHGLGHGHAMTLAQVIRHLDDIDLANATPAGPPPGSIGRLWLDGAATNPA
ncbi:DUF4287 domain-containing protein [Microbacterium invictum]|uniref:DUF4287 domain-containing protein n=1 Tax=Microbacterium invictum TaxID=515415 RepID=A0ABZ0VAJ3_9MICO|nr:DUF4287 domain-containing protein [Microbacterium invictum]WQB70484.1 DUF4287 domain-containing protein [Microbacterium invictum]